MPAWLFLSTFRCFSERADVQLSIQAPAMRRCQSVRPEDRGGSGTARFSDSGSSKPAVLLRGSARGGRSPILINERSQANWFSFGLAGKRTASVIHERNPLRHPILAQALPRNRIPPHAPADEA